MKCEYKTMQLVKNNCIDSNAKRLNSNKEIEYNLKTIDMH